MSKHSPGPQHGQASTGDERVNRIIEQLARLSFDPNGSAPVGGASVTEESEFSGRFLGWLIQARRIRRKHFPKELVTGPAWDMLLELLQAKIQKAHLDLSRLVSASGVSATTAARWVSALEQCGLVEPASNPRAIENGPVQLTPKAEVAFCEYFRELAKSIHS